MRAKNALSGTLPRPRELKSNRKEDIQDFLERLLKDLDKQWRLLHQDVATIQVDDDGYIYFGNKDTAGTWRIGRDGLDWIMEYQAVVGTWTRIDTAKGS
ncbi:MAG: hypothetical protein ACYS1A_16765 [Planctomycetota bacterium]|jgi:hypothetical protein